MRPRTRYLGWSAAILAASATCLLASALMCVLPLAVERSQSPVATLNARLCLEQQYADAVTLSVGAYYRAGSGPLPAPSVTSYRMCVYIPWADNLPAQAALVLPPWRAPK
jgi:hypothetical protein